MVNNELMKSNRESSEVTLISYVQLTNKKEESKTDGFTFCNYVLYSCCLGCCSFLSENLFRNIKMS